MNKATTAAQDIAVTIPAPVTVATKAAIVAAIAGRTGRPFELRVTTGPEVKVTTTMRRVGPATLAKWETAIRVAIRPLWRGPAPK